MLLSLTGRQLPGDRRPGFRGHQPGQAL